MRVAIGMVRRQPHRSQQLVHPRVDFLTSCELVNDEWLGDDIADSHSRVQARVGVLHNVLLLPAQGAHVAASDIRDILAFEKNLARGWFEQAEHASPKGCFARARFSNESQCLAALDSKRYAVNGFDVSHMAREQASCYGEVLGCFADVDEWGRPSVDRYITGHRQPPVSTTSPRPHLTADGA